MEQICKLIEDSLNELTKIGEEDKPHTSEASVSRLLFPKYGHQEDEKQEIRRSEQELRFLLVEILKRQNLEFYYSVETPTQKKYSFSEEGEFRSGNIDLCLYDNTGNRAHLIELKYGPNDDIDIAKDLLKLLYEPSKGQNYFIHFICNTKGSLSSIAKMAKKFEKVLMRIKEESYKPKTDKKMVVELEGNKFIKVERGEGEDAISDLKIFLFWFEKNGEKSKKDLKKVLHIWEIKGSDFLKDFDAKKWEPPIEEK